MNARALLDAMMANDTTCAAIRARMEADDIEPENPRRLSKMYGLAPFWIAPDGALYDGHGAGERHHYAIAANYIAPGTDDPMQAAHGKGWLRVNISPSDNLIMVNAGRYTRAAKQTLEDLAYSQDLGVEDDDGRTVIESPNPPDKEDGQEEDLW